MSFELGRALLATDAVSPAALAEAFLTSAREGVSLVRALLLRGVDPDRLEAELWRTESPSVRTVLPARELVDRLPPELCARLMAVPVKRDPATGTIEVVVADLRDAQGAVEIGWLLQSPVRAVRAPIAAIERALRGAEPAREPELAMSRRMPTPAWGVDLSPASPMPSERVAPASTPPEEVVIPLVRRSLSPGAPSLRAPPALVLAHPEVPSEHPPANDLAGAVEQAIQARSPNTLIPPPTESLPPPPNTERRPPTFASSRPPPRMDGARASEPPFGFIDAGSIFAQMRTATERDDVLRLLLAGTRAVARKVALFVVKKDELVGWACTPEFGDERALRTVAIRADVPSVLSVAATNGSYLGPLHRTDVHAPILRTMGSASRDVAIVPVRVFGRPTVVVLADDLGDTMIATRRMDELARAAGEALARIVRERADRG